VIVWAVLRTIAGRVCRNWWRLETAEFYEAGGGVEFGFSVPGSGQSFAGGVGFISMHARKRFIAVAPLPRCGDNELLDPY
jgi:hypothetical protein